MARRRLTIDEAGAIACEYPGVSAGTSYGTRGWRMGKKFLMREKEKMDDVLVLGLANVDEQEFLIETQPEAFFITDHYRGYPAVLVRLAAIDRKTLTGLIDAAWRRLATKKMRAERDERGK